MSCPVRFVLALILGLLRGMGGESIIEPRTADEFANWPKERKPDVWQPN